MESRPNHCYGRTDLPLASGWRNHLPELAQSLASIRLIHTSPLSRCRLVAEALAERLRVPMRVDPRLIELDFGEWDGLDWDVVPRDALDRWAADPAAFAPPGGETGWALIERIGAFLNDLRLDRRCCLVVSHGGPLRLLGPMLRGEAPDLLAPGPSMGELRIVQRPGGYPQASSVNSTHSDATQVAPSTSPV